MICDKHSFRNYGFLSVPYTGETIMFCDGQIFYLFILFKSRFHIFGPRLHDHYDRWGILAVPQLIKGG